MRICFFNDSMGVGGPEIWALDATRKLVGRGHTAVVGCPSGSWMEREAEKCGLPLFDYPIEPEFEANLRWQLAETLVENRIDLICCGIPGSRIEAPILHQAVLEAGRGAVVLRLGVAPGDGALSPEQIGVGLDSVQGILAVSTDIRTRLLTQFPSLQPDRVHVMYNGVDLERFHKAAKTDRNRVRTRLGLPRDRRLIAAVGRLDRVKDHAALIQAAPAVLERFPNTAFVIAGDGPERLELLQMANQLGVSESIYLTGFVENVPELLASVDVLAHPSYSEGVPNAVIEAMASRLPVVATRVGGIPEVVVSKGGEEDTGILIQRGDTEQLSYGLCRLLESDDLRRQMGQRGQDRIMASFDRNACLDALVQVFERIVEETPAPNPAAAPALVDLPLAGYADGCALLRATASR